MSLDSVVFALKSCFKTKHQKSFFTLLQRLRDAEKRDPGNEVGPIHRFPGRSVPVLPTQLPLGAVVVVEHHISRSV